MKILLVEDDKDLADTIGDILKSRFMVVTICYNFTQAYNELKNPYDCYLLDNRLPDGSGIELCRFIRDISNNPVILISSDKNESSILRSFNLRADDYIEKPFHLKVLLAKIESVMRRFGYYTDIYKIENSILDVNQHFLQIENTEYKLSISEVALLEGLFKAYPKFVTRAELCNLIFSKTGNITTKETLSVRCSELKKKLETNSFKIESSRDLGYRWKS